MSVLISLLKGVITSRRPPSTKEEAGVSVNQHADPSMRRFLHVGCGSLRKPNVSPGFAGEDWLEVRLDIDERVDPDIVASMLDMRVVADGTFDALFSSHNIEHLFAHEVLIALHEFRRVLKGDGFAVITCPDIRPVCALVAQGKLTDTAYDSPAGPIAPIDMLWGLRSSLAAGNHWMAHKCGFTEGMLASLLQECGFASVATKCRPSPDFELWALATCSHVTKEKLDSLTARHFPC